MSVIEKTAVLPGGAWAADPRHSSASFAVRHSVASFRGGFRNLDARLESVDGEPRLTGLVGVESIDVEDEELRPHLLSPEFFDAERSPEVSFESTSIEADGDELVVRGELEIQGNRRGLTARGHATEPAPGPGDTERFGLELVAEIDRTEYGLNWNMELPGGGTALGEEVELTVNLEFIREDGAES